MQDKQSYFSQQYQQVFYSNMILVFLMATLLLLYKCYSGAYYLATNRLLIVVIHISQNQRRSER